MLKPIYVEHPLSGESPLKMHKRHQLSEFSTKK